MKPSPSIAEVARSVGVSRQAIMGALRRGKLASLSASHVAEYRREHRARIASRNKSRALEAARLAAKAKEGTY